MEHKNRKQRHPYLWAILYGILLTGYTVFTLLDAFVIPRDMIYLDDLPGNDPHQVLEQQSPQPGSDSSSVPETTEAESSAPDPLEPKFPPAEETPAQTIITDTSYEDENISIHITTERRYDTQVYFAEVQLKESSSLKTGLAGGAFGRNLSETTSAMAEENGAILAINGDYYGFRDTGFVMRNGYLYRNTARASGSDDALVIYGDGRMENIRETETTADALVENGAEQIFSFGPALIQDSEISVTQTSEVEQAMRSNPRTAIGQIGPLHYIFLVSDGQTSESTGLTLWQVAETMQELGCKTAYNLDGGGSSAMWFMGRIVNNPTSGWREGERKVSDIVYIGE